MPAFSGFGAKDNRQTNRIIMKKIICVLTAVILLSISSSASAESPEEIYSKQYESSGIGRMYDELPDSAKELLENIGVDARSGELPQLSVSGVFEHIFGLLKGGMKAPLTACISLIGLILILSLITSAMGEKNNYAAVQLVGVLCIASAVLVPMYQSVEVAISEIRSATAFMSATVPIYAAVIISGGFTATGTASAAMLQAATQGVAQLISFGLAPLMGMYLALAISACVSPINSAERLAEFIKKVATWSLSAALTLFLGVLSIQSNIAASADSLSLKAARYLVGNIPLVGSAVGEAVSAVKSSVSLLGTSAAGYAVVALAAILIPVILELALWRLALNVGAVVSGMVCAPKVEGLLRSCDSAMAFFAGIAIYVGLLFIISFAVVSSAVGGVAM